jgi:hypothetical protein
MSLLQYVSFFRNEQKESEDQTYALATSILDWMRQDYHVVFEAWLEAQASKPFKIGPELVESAMRVNVLREVQRHLAKLKSEAMAARERIREGE